MVNELDLDNLLREPEVAPLATRLGYLPEMADVQRARLRHDLDRAVRRARTAEAHGRGHSRRT